MIVTVIATPLQRYLDGLEVVANVVAALVKREEVRRVDKGR